MKIKEGGVMDIQKEREAFELSFKETDFSKMNLVNCFCFITDRYVWDEVQAAWEMWQTAIARMEVRINALDEMLLNQGEALAEAKAQAVPAQLDVNSILHDIDCYFDNGLSNTERTANNLLQSIYENLSGEVKAQEPAND